jgi:hypothetical protein
MVGIPGQSFDSLAGDIDLPCLELDMIGLGHTSHPETPLGMGSGRGPS